LEAGRRVARLTTDDGKGRPAYGIFSSRDRDREEIEIEKRREEIEKRREEIEKRRDREREEKGIGSTVVCIDLRHSLILETQARQCRATRDDKPRITYPVNTSFCIMTLSANNS